MFLLRLAREHHIPFNEFMERIDSEEINLYLALEELIPSLPDPYGINAINCYVTARVGGSKAQPDDFIPKVNKPKPATELKAQFKALANLKR